MAIIFLYISIFFSLLFILLSCSSECPLCPCFNCSEASCRHQGLCISSKAECMCGPMFSGFDCSLPQCVHGYLDSRTLNCSCDSGWKGHWCEICASADSCLKSSSLSQCDHSVFPFKLKRYSCTSSDQGIVTLLKGQRGLVTLSIETLPNSSMHGNFQFFAAEDNVKLLPREDLFSCSFTDCTDESTRRTFKVDCENLTCNKECISGRGKCTTIFESIIKSIEGKVSLSCSEEDHLCLVSAPVLNVLSSGGLRLSCTMGECVSDSSDKRELNKTNNNKKSLEVLVNEVTIICLVLLPAAVIGLMALMGARKYFKDKKAPEGEAYYNNDALKAHLRELCQPEGPIDLSFSDISCFVESRNTRATCPILNAITGTASAGELFALIGPSGAGKSTLLTILGKRYKRGRISGHIFLDGKIRTKHYKRLIGFVAQEDCLLSTLSVRENLLFSALLRLPDTMPFQLKKNIVEGVLEDLELTGLADQPVGSTVGGGLSGGERRRVSIAMELVTWPSVLLLDEPTSGLDTFNAQLVVRCLWRLARTNKTTIVMSVHQPSSVIFQLLDKILLLAKGEMVFLGTPAESLSHFSSIGFLVPDNYNPADFLIDVIVHAQRLSETTLPPLQAQPSRCSTPGPADHTHKSRLDLPFKGDLTQRDLDLSSLVDHYRASEAFIRHCPRGMGNDRVTVSATPRKGASFTTQLVVVSARALRHLLRDPFLFWGHLAASVVIGVVLGVLYGGLNSTGKSQGLIAQFEQLLGLLLLMCAFLSFGSLSSIETFHRDKLLYCHERSNRFYTPAAYFLAKIAIDFLSLRILSPVLMGLIAHFMIGLRSGQLYLLRFLVTLVLVNFAASSFCMLFGSLSSRTSTANLAGSLFMLASLLLTNLFNNPKSMTPYVAWLHYCSFFNYGYEAIVVNELEGTFLTGKVLGADGVSVSGSSILKDLGFEAKNLLMDLYILVIIIFVVQLLTFLSLKFLAHRFV